MAGNWKMNLNHLEAIALVQKLAFDLTPRARRRSSASSCRPFVDLRSVQTLVDGDQARPRLRRAGPVAHDSGATPGTTSGAMLAKLGCSYVLVGHSERRQTPRRDRPARQREGEGRLPARG
jgi:triosephosphate isomerase